MSSNAMSDSPRPILVLNGPNLNMLGLREPEIYGPDSLADIEAAVADRARDHGLEADFRQSNHEGELVAWIQEARSSHEAIIINAAGYSHGSLAIADALRLAELPLIEVHLSNIFAREPTRRHSVIAPLADGVICGLGATGYVLAIDAAAGLIDRG